MSTNKFKGLNESEIYKIYVSLCFYEHYLKQCQTDKRLDDVNHDLTEKLKEWSGSLKYSFCKKRDLSTFCLMPMPNTIVCTRGRSRLIVFLKHFRNAIAHGLIERDSDKNVVFFDYFEGSKSNISARCKMENCIFTQLLELLYEEAKKNI